MLHHDELEGSTYNSSRVCDMDAARLYDDADTEYMPNICVMGMGEVVEAEHY